jgi:hypothetical protein
MVSLMARNNCRTWLATVTNTGQPYPAVAGSQRTVTVTDEQVTDLRSQTAGAQTNRANVQIIKVHVEHHTVTPTFLPINPETIEPNKGNIIIERYIMFLVIYFLLIDNKQQEYLNLLLIQHLQ